MSTKYVNGMHTEDVDEDSEMEELSDDMWAAIFDQFQTAPMHKCPLFFLTWCEDCEVMTCVEGNRNVSQCECGDIPRRLCRGDFKGNGKQPSGQAVKQHLRDKATSCQYHDALLEFGNEERMVDKRKKEKR